MRVLIVLIVFVVGDTVPGMGIVRIIRILCDYRGSYANRRPVSGDIYSGNGNVVFPMWKAINSLLYGIGKANAQLRG